ncbi:MAG TPA: DHA2 family efflux MFS transporter permease subunit [Pseudonocardia sp.]|jgi:EmrB/QacA subfamily drug resistance transporter
MTQAEPLARVPNSAPSAPAGPVSPDASAPSVPVRLVLAAAVAIALGTFLSVLDSSIVGVAYPAIEKDLGATSESTQWITTAYKLCQGVVIPAAVWLCRRFGLSRMYLISLLGYAVTSALCAVAPNIDLLVAFRVLQAIPGALTPIVCIGIIYVLIPKAAQAIAFAVYAMIAISAPGFAPYLGGWLVEYVNWRAIFVLTVPVALVGIAAALALLPPMRPVEKPPRFDFAGFVCLSAGSCCLLLALSKGPQWGWTSYLIVGLLLMGANALLLFVAVELRVPHPILNLRIFTVRPFVVAVLVLEVLFVGVTTMISFLPVFLLQAQVMTPSQAGEVLVPQAIFWILALPVSGVLWMFIGARRVTIIGLVLMGGGTLALSGLNVDVTRGELMLLLSLRAVGLGLVMIPMLGGAVFALPPHLVPDGVAFRTIVQRTGASLGLAALSVLVTVRKAQQMADQTGLLDLAAPYRIPTIQQMQQKGPGGLVPLWEELQAHALTNAYADAFLVLGVVTVAAVGLVLCADWPAPPRRPMRKELVEVGV